MFEMLHTAGIYIQNKEQLKIYVKHYMDSCKHCDVLGVWSGCMYTQAKPFYDLFHKLSPNTKEICSQALEPYYFMNHPEYNYNKVFEGKKVLIISSHLHSVNQQLHKQVHKKNIFSSDTEFYVYKPPQQNAGNTDGNPWIYHFNTMKQEITELSKEFDFDIALISCGGFGMITSDFIFTQLKKSVMYIGGSIQLFFGITEPGPA